MESRRGFLLTVAGLPLTLYARLVSAKLVPREPLASIEQRVFKAINFQRVSHVSSGAGPLVWSDRLAATSRMHSARMLEAGFFGHEDPKYGNLSARMAAAGVDYSRCGENVFREQNYDDPVSIAVVEWMYSEPHRENLLMPQYTLTGVGAAMDADGTVAVTQQFLTPGPSPAARTSTTAR
jgi:uncharacterized protein YkwD